MTNNNNQISLTYTNAELRNLIEEFITQRKEDFTLRDVSSYVLYWAVEDGKVADENGLIEGDALQQSDQGRVEKVLEAIIADGRIVINPTGYYIKAYYK